MVDIAYTAVINDKGENRLGIAKRDQPGYYPIRDEFDLGGTYESYDAATRVAELANERLGLTKQEAQLIVLSSIRAQDEQNRRLA